MYFILIKNLEEVVTFVSKPPRLCAAACIFISPRLGFQVS